MQLIFQINRLFMFIMFHFFLHVEVARIFPKGRVTVATTLGRRSSPLPKAKDCLCLFVMETSRMWVIPPQRVHLELIENIYELVGGSTAMKYLNLFVPLQQYVCIKFGACLSVCCGEYLYECSCPFFFVMVSCCKGLSFPVVRTSCKKKLSWVCCIYTNSQVATRTSTTDAFGC